MVVVVNNDADLPSRTHTTYQPVIISHVSISLWNVRRSVGWPLRPCGLSALHRRVGRHIVGLRHFRRSDDARTVLVQDTEGLRRHKQLSLSQTETRRSENKTCSLSWRHIVTARQLLLIQLFNRWIQYKLVPTFTPSFPKDPQSHSYTFHLVDPVHTKLIHLSTDATDKLIVAHGTRAITIEGGEKAELFGGAEAQVEAVEEPSTGYDGQPSDLLWFPKDIVYRPSHEDPRPKPSDTCKLETRHTSRAVMNSSFVSSPDLSSKNVRGAKSWERDWYTLDWHVTNSDRTR